MCLTSSWSALLLWRPEVVQGSGHGSHTLSFASEAYYYQAANIHTHKNGEDIHICYISEKGFLYVQKGVNFSEKGFYMLESAIVEIWWAR